MIIIALAAGLCAALSTTILVLDYVKTKKDG